MNYIMLTKKCSDRIIRITTWVICFTVAFTYMPISGIGNWNAQADELPFSIQDTDYGVENDRVVAKQIKLTNAHYIGKKRHTGYGLVAVGGREHSYLIGKNGLIRTYDDNDDNLSFYNMAYWNREHILNNYPDELYVIHNPDTDGLDLYNATQDIYYDYSADFIGLFTSGGGNYFETTRLIDIEKDGKRGLLNNRGEQIVEPEYDWFESKSNCLIGKKDDEEYLIKDNGEVSGPFDWCRDYDEQVCAVRREGKYACISTNTLRLLSDFKYDGGSLRTYEYNGNLFHYDIDEKELISETGIIDLEEEYDTDDIDCFEGNGADVFRITKWGYETVKRIWLSPDGREEYKNVTYENDGTYFPDKDDGDIVYLNNIRMARSEPDSKLRIQDEFGNHVMGVEALAGYKVVGNYIIGYTKDDDGVIKYYFYNYLDGALVAKDVVYRSSEQYLGLTTIISEDVPNKYGIIDLYTGKVGFSGYVYDLQGFDIDRDDLSINRAYRLDDNGWVCSVTHQTYEKLVTKGVINSNFQLIADGYDIRSIGSDGALRIVMRQGEEGNTRITDFEGNVLLERNDIEQYAYGDILPYKDVYPIIHYDDEDDVDMYGLVTADGDEVLECNNNYVGPCINGFVYYENKDHSGIITKSGDDVIRGEFESNRSNSYIANYYSTTTLEYDDDIYIYDYSKCDIDSTSTDKYSNVRGSFTTGDKVFKKEKGEGYCYKDSYFDKGATEYQHSLATMSLCMAFSTYGEGAYSEYDKNVKRIMKECGFAQHDRYKQYHFNEKPTQTSIGCAIGSKDINGETVIAVAVRSGGYEDEWASNVSVNSRDDHAGFNSSAETVKDYIISYIQEKNIEGNIKIWITGYSRGAATATMAAAKLDDLSGFGYSKGNKNLRVDFDKNGIYAYGFATPAGAIKSSNPHDGKYNNIFNVIEFNDPVPLVAPKEWGFDRYGTTKILPYRESNDSNNYNEYIGRLRKKMDDEYMLDEFVNYKMLSGVIEDFFNHDTLGSYNRKLIKAISTHVMKSRSDYSNNYQQGLVHEIIKYFKKGKYEFQMNDLIFRVLEGATNAYLFINRDIYATAIQNRALLADVHANQKYYVYWMQLMDPNYKNSLPLIWGKANYRMFKANCPVDVYVYDINGNELASIIDDIPVNGMLSDDDYYDSGIITTIDENGSKVVYLPVGGKYEISVIAREKCSVSCGFEEYNAEYGDYARVTNFKTMTLKSNEKLKSSVDAYSSSELENGATEGSNTAYILKKDNQTIETTVDLKGSNEIAQHTYTVGTKCDARQGELHGGGEYVKGSFVKLQAVNKPGFALEGFYVDGKRIDTEANDNYSVRIQVNKDTVVEAKYNKCSHNWNSGIVLKKPSVTSTGLKKYTCEVCGQTRTESIPKLVQKVKKINVSSDPSLSIAAGKKTRLKETIVPNNATDKRVVWKSSNKKYATVSANGTVNTKKAGRGKSVIITATAADGSGVVAKVKLSIKKGIVKKITVSGKKKIKVGKSTKLKIKIKASAGANKKVKWVTSNPKYATVNSSGKVITKKGGKGKKVTIIAVSTDGSGKKGRIRIKIQ